MASVVAFGFWFCSLSVQTALPASGPLLTISHAVPEAAKVTLTQDKLHDEITQMRVRLARLLPLPQVVRARLAPPKFAVLPSPPT